MRLPDGAKEAIQLVLELRSDGLSTVNAATTIAIRMRKRDNTEYVN